MKKCQQSWRTLEWFELSRFRGNHNQPWISFFSECFYLQTGILVLTYFWSPKHLQSWKTRSASAGLGENPLALRVYWVVDFHWPEQTCSGAQLPTIRIRSIPANKRNGALFFLLFVGWGGAGRGGGYWAEQSMFCDPSGVGTTRDVETKCRKTYHKTKRQSHELQLRLLIGLIWTLSLLIFMQFQHVARHSPITMKPRVLMY